MDSAEYFPWNPQSLKLRRSSSIVSELAILLHAIILVPMPGSGVGELFDGPAFIATQPAILAEEPVARGVVSL